MYEEKKEGKRRKMSGTALQITGSAACLLLGILLTFVPTVNIRTLCYIVCAALVAAGLACAIWFFASGAYRRLDDYNFALGVMLMILGCCGFARIEGMETAFLTYAGFLVLALGIFALQNTVQLRVVGNELWLVCLLCTVVILFGGITIILDLRAVWNAVQYWILTVAGALGLAAWVVTAVVLWRRGRDASASGRSEAGNHAETEDAASGTALPAEASQSEARFPETAVEGLAQDRPVFPKENEE